MKPRVDGGKSSLKGVPDLCHKTDIVHRIVQKRKKAKGNQTNFLDMHRIIFHTRTGRTKTAAAILDTSSIPFGSESGSVVVSLALVVRDISCSHMMPLFWQWWGKQGEETDATVKFEKGKKRGKKEKKNQTYRKIGGKNERNSSEDKRESNLFATSQCEKKCGGKMGENDTAKKAGLFGLHLIRIDVLVVHHVLSILGAFFTGEEEDEAAVSKGFQIV